MKRLVLIAFLFLISVSSRSQELVKFDELTFSSEYEKQALTAYFADKQSDYFKLFIAGGTALNENAIQQASEKFHKHLAQLKEKATNKRREKNIKLIYDDIHDAFFKKYEEQNKFEDIFINGHYNCVSATALYAMVFDYLNIPYTIKESPRHVYLLAYPTEEKIIIETTDPSQGSTVITPQFKLIFVTGLKNRKMISEQEFKNSSINELFDRHYFLNDHDITMRQLVGIQYSNEGIYYYQAKQHLNALHAFEKSYLFYPTEQSSLGMMETAHVLFKENSAKDLKHAIALGKLSKFQNHGITPEMIEGEYARVITDLLFDKGDAEKLSQYHAELLNSLANISLENNIQFLYHYEMARWLFNDRKLSESLDNLRECLKLRPNHSETERLLLASVSESVRNQPNSELVKGLEKYAAEFPVLLKNNNFKEMLGTTYLLEMRRLFDDNKPTDAEKMKITFENFHGANNSIVFNNYILGQAYSSAAVYYFRKGNSAKAKSILNKGLQISPDNYELTSRMRMIQ
jgi:tetratricopeptide (TPR) repeat protein